MSSFALRRVGHAPVIHSFSALAPCELRLKSCSPDAAQALVMLPVENQEAMQASTTTQSPDRCALQHSSVTQALQRSTHLISTDARRYQRLLLPPCRPWLRYFTTPLERNMEARKSTTSSFRPSSPLSARRRLSLGTCAAHDTAAYIHARRASPHAQNHPRCCAVIVPFLQPTWTPSPILASSRRSRAASASRRRCRSSARPSSEERRCSRTCRCAAAHRLGAGCAAGRRPPVRDGGAAAKW